MKASPILLAIVATVLVCGGGAFYGYRALAAQVESQRQVSAQLKSELQSETNAARDVVSACSRLSKVIAQEPQS